MARAEQQHLRFPNTHGGRREGAGRPKGTRRSTRMPHVARAPVSRHKPHHVTARVTRGTWNLRSQCCFTRVRAAITHVGERDDFRIVHFSVQHNHLHLIVEADSRRAMSDGLRALFALLARELNIVMRVAGRRFDDRFHEHVLRTPTEVRNALRYVLGNRAVHLARWGADVRGLEVDPLCSLVIQIAKPPQSWLLREGWTRAGPFALATPSDSATKRRHGRKS